jgi:phenylpropionate dioxygenase-like ring-hydroxylating dioxygenase large terminal subunit
MDTVPAFARTFAYPAAERHGCVWIFAGREPAFPLPSFAEWPHDRLHVSRLPPRTMECHPHLAVMNGLDIQHFKTVHELDFIDEPEVRALDAYRVQARLNVRLRAGGAAARVLRLLSATRFTGSFTTWGGNMATIEGRVGPVPLLVLFTHRPVDGARSASQTFLFAPRARGWRRLAPAAPVMLAIARLVMAYLLQRDRDVLEAVDFQPHLVPADAPLAAFMRQVEAMPLLDAPARP